MAFQQPFSLCPFLFIYFFLDDLLRSSSDRITSMARMGLKKNAGKKGVVFGKERQEFCGVNLFQSGRRSRSFRDDFGCMMYEAE